MWTDTIISASKCSISDIVFEAKIDDSKNFTDEIKFSEKWKGVNHMTTSSILKSMQDDNFGKIIKKSK